MAIRNKLYFASDMHLGSRGYAVSREREARLVRWLDMIKADAAELFLIGDVFDFWFEYKTVVPRGYIRFLGKLAELSDAGVKLYLFKGNHDMWMFNYFEQELGATVISNELVIERSGKRFFLHHGDGLEKGDRSYKLLKKIFRSPVCQWLFARLHPNLSVGVANYWSSQSRDAGIKSFEEQNRRPELLLDYCNTVLETEFYDYLIFGHKHRPLDVQLNDKSRYINLGEWMTGSTYAVFDGNDVSLKHFEG